MFLNKKNIVLILILFPSFCFNYLTLTIIDHDNNLSFFSTIFIIIFNLINLFFAFIYYKYNFKTLIFLSLYCSALFVVFDFTSEKFFNKNSIIKDDKILGWTLKSNKTVKFKQQTFKGEKYIVNFKSSKIEGFREYSDPNSKNKKILIIGDSYTGGPYASNEKMYYNIIKKEFIKNNIDLEWFVLGAGGYGTAQQLLLVEEYQDIIKPDIILHQFCVNDFFDNSIEISRLSTSHNQYYRRPYMIENKIIKVDNFISYTYRFLFKYSFIFKKFDQIYMYKKFRNYGRFTQKISNDLIEKTVKNTEDLIFKIRERVGKNTLYFSINCADKNNNNLSFFWEQIINKIGGYPLIKPANSIIELKDKGEDVVHEDGGHLNEYGNKIYGEIAAEEMLNILKYVEY